MQRGLQLFERSRELVLARSAGHDLLTMRDGFFYHEEVQARDPDSPPNTARHAAALPSPCSVLLQSGTRAENWEICFLSPGPRLICSGLHWSSLRRAGRMRNLSYWCLVSTSWHFCKGQKACAAVSRSHHAASEPTRCHSQNTDESGRRLMRASLRH